MSNCKWLEVLHSAIRDQLQSKEDCLVAVFHCLMINKGYKCVGIGDAWDQESDAASDLLPLNWNTHQETYTLRYTDSSDKKSLMKIIKLNDCLLVNVLDVAKSQAAGISVKTESHVGNDFKIYSAAYKNLGEVEQQFANAIYEKDQSKDKPAKKVKSPKGSSTQYEDPSPLFVERDTRTFSEPSRVMFPSVGRDDLDPFGGLYSGGTGGGMLYDPVGMGRNRGPHVPPHFGGPGGLPRGAVPPGARFDPFGPPMPGRGPNSGPDPDELPPPGFHDSFI